MLGRFLSYGNGPSSGLQALYQENLGRDPDPDGRQAIASSNVGPPAPSNQEINAFVQANINNPQAIAAAAQQYNVSPERISEATGYTPQQVTKTFSEIGYLFDRPKTPGPTGIANLPSANASVASPVVQSVLSGTPTTQQITDVYRQVLGRDPDPEGLSYWSQYTGPNIMEAFITAAQPEAQKTGAVPLIGSQVSLSGKPTDAEIKAFVAANINNPTAIVDAANQYGISAQDIKRATGYNVSQMASYLAGSNIIGEQTPDYDLSEFKRLNPQKIERAQEFAQKYLGRPMTEAELYTVGLGYTGANLQTQVKTLAEMDDINRFYQDVYGRAPTIEELYQGTQQINWKNAQEKLLPTLGKTEEALNAKVFGTNNDISAREIQDFVAANQANPAAILAAATKFGVTPEEISTAMRATGKEATGIINSYTNAKTIEDAFKTAGIDTTNNQTFNQYYNDLQTGKMTTQEFTTKFFDDQLNNLASFEAARSNISGDPFSDPAIAAAYKPQNITSLYQYTTDKTLKEVLGEDSANYKQDTNALINDLVTGRITREQYEQQVQNSQANINQEAARLAGLYTQLSGGDQNDARAFYAALTGARYSGAGDVDPVLLGKAKDQLKTSIKNESSSSDVLSQIIDEAADKPGAKDSEFFKKNPQLYEIYSPVGETKAFTNAGTGGQYGYYKGIPILKASEADQVFDKLGDYIIGNRPDRLDNDIGWDTGSLSAVQARGAAALGVRKQDGYVDPMTGVEIPATYSGDLEGLAKKFNIDTSKFKDTYKEVTVTDPETGEKTKQQVIDKRAEDQLFDAVNEAAKDFYFIAGKTGKGETNSKGETSAFMRDDVSGNHAAVLYRKVGDKLIPLENTLKYYNGQMELSPGSWFSDTFGGIASIPFVAELALLTGQPWAYAAAKAAQTAALGGEFKDMAKSAAMAYAAQNLLPQVGSEISGGLGNLGVTNQIANQALTGATISGGLAGLTGGDIKEAATSGAVGAGLSAGVNTLLPEVNTAVKDAFNLTNDQARIFTNTLARIAPTILTGGKIDATKLIMNYLMAQALGGAKKEVKRAGYRPTSQGTE